MHFLTIQFLSIQFLAIIVLFNSALLKDEGGRPASTVAFLEFLVGDAPGPLEVQTESPLRFWSAACCTPA